MQQCLYTDRAEASYCFQVSHRGLMVILDCLVSSRITAIHNNIVKNPNWSFTSVAEAPVEKLQVLLRS